MIRSGYEGNGIADKANLFIQNEPVIGTGFGIGLAGNGKPRLGDVIGRCDTDDARNLLSGTLIDLFNDSSGMGTPQDFDDEAVFRHDVFRIDWLPGNQGLRILFGHDLIDRFKFHQDRTSFPLALKNFLMALIWLIYPVQRQRLPDKNSLISSSVGESKRRTMDKTFMTKPGLQKPH